MKICGPAVHGQIGDLVGNTVFCRSIKELYPDCELTFAIGNKYKKCSFLFEQNKLMDKIHTWDSYDNFPSQNDIKFINESKFDIVFNPKQPHTRQDWYNYFSYCQEWTLMHGLPTASNLEPYLNPWYHDPKKQKIVTLSAFPGTDSAFDKSLTLENWGKICRFIRSLGYTPIELGGFFAKDIENCERPDLSLMDSCKLLLDSSLHLSTDCGLGWIAAGYKKNVLGFYTNSQPNMTHSWSHWPANPNAHYLHYNDIKNNVNLDGIFSMIKDKLC
jgi:ADP-heptose:LPS heptosyltransferase